ncbi:MAG: tRNA pseudouridine(55) synthase TruB [candidate division KSB1 bacterium]|nr:tRNA pseudouridine(55) synthase TruB [candidate division KSB1 bacterium]MDZ7318971.1 tRNA pseudouridine(55) synthase TruB [candidate division KSB1 bacterium]MDZ7340567.1 tRNA pseudouridine(55) synthase TruB [candidate division KSB1 bacterium]
MNWFGTPFDFAAGAILNFHKPPGKSSFWLVKQIRSQIKTKVGHAGTLDPFAEGVLLICTGRATRQVEQLMGLTKEYVGEIELGISTDTDDPTGKIIAQASVPALTPEDLQAVCQSFVGSIYQLPPLFSAKQVQGRRLYKLARQGVAIERTPKLVHIETIELLRYEHHTLALRVICSKGTYIRALARDIGQQIGCGGYLKTLIRTRIGDYSIDDALNWQQFNEMIAHLDHQ